MPPYALVLTAPDLTTGDKAVAQRILSRSGAGEPVVLCPDKACEWKLDLRLHEADELLRLVRSELADLAIDINLVSAGADRRKQLLIADMDSTIIEQECIDEIAVFAGCADEVAAITERAMRGELDFEDALRVRVGLLEGLDTAALERVVAERLSITPGATALVRTMAANGAYCALVSGGFTFFTSRIAARVGFHENRANTLEIDQNRLTGKPTPPVLGRQAKLDALLELCSRHDHSPNGALAVGDGANDLDMIRAAGLGVAFRAKPVVGAEADAQITYSDLTALLYLQGYRYSELVCSQSAH